MTRLTKTGISQHAFNYMALPLILLNAFIIANYISTQIKKTKDVILPIHNYYPHLINKRTQPGSVVVERSPDMREVGGSIPGHVKQKTLKFEVLRLCLAISTKELAADWPARSQD